MAAAIDAPVTVMDTAGEGGAWGIALLASYRVNKKDGQTLEEFLAQQVFVGQEGSTMEPDASDVAGYNEFMKGYTASLAIERAAVDTMKV